MTKKIIAIIVLLFMLVSIPVGVFLVKKRQEIQLRAAPATVLSLFPAAEDYEKDEVFTLDIKVETGPNIIIGADLFLNFDPQIIEAQSVSLGTFLPNAQEATNQVNNNLGTIIYSLFTTQENAQSGTGTLAQITFKGKNAGTSAVSFGSQTSVAGIDDAEALKEGGAISGSYLIVEAQPTVTPTLIPTPTGGAGELGEPIATPTVTPTPTTTDEDEGDGGVGGGAVATATPTPTPTTAAKTILTPTPTVSEELPEAGVPTVTFLFLIGGGLLLLLSFGRLLFP
jgi:hypothetical protein